MGAHAGDGPDSIDGMELDEAVEAVVERGEANETGTARAVLEHAVADGVVSHEGVEEKSKEVSKVVMTAESRVEFAEREVVDAREAAQSVDDLDVVAFHLAEFDDRLSALEAAVDRLSALLDSAVDRTSWGTIYDATLELLEVRSEATAVQQRADELQMDAEEFGYWLEDRDRRYRELGEDLDALVDSIDDLGDAVDWLADRADNAEGDGDGPDTGGDDLGLAWADTTLRVGVLDLFLDDVRAEFADLRAWDEREDVADGGTAADLEARIDEADRRCVALADRLDDLADPAWRERFDDDLGAFEETLGVYDPPVDWTDVQDALETYRSQIGATA